MDASANKLRCKSAQVAASQGPPKSWWSLEATNCTVSWWLRVSACGNTMMKLLICWSAQISRQETWKNHQNGQKGSSMLIYTKVFWNSVLARHTVRTGLRANFWGMLGDWLDLTENSTKQPSFRILIPIGWDDNQSCHSWVPCRRSGEFVCDSVCVTSWAADIDVKPIWLNLIRAWWWPNLSGTGEVCCDSQFVLLRNSRLNNMAIHGLVGTSFTNTWDGWQLWLYNKYTDFVARSPTQKVVAGLHRFKCTLRDPKNGADDSAFVFADIGHSIHSSNCGNRSGEVSFRIVSLHIFHWSSYPRSQGGGLHFEYQREVIVIESAFLQNISKRISAYEPHHVSLESHPKQTTQSYALISSLILNSSRVSLLAHVSTTKVLICLVVFPRLTRQLWIALLSHWWWWPLPSGFQQSSCTARMPKTRLIRSRN